MIKDKIEHLLTLPDEVFAYYLFSQDPLKDKVSVPEKREVIEKSLREGREVSRKLKSTYGQLSVDEYISKLDIQLTYEEAHNGMEYIYFGTYQNPNKMTIYTENIEKGMQLAESEKIPLVEEVNLIDVVKSHELFHYFQETDKELYINTNKITLWKMFKYKHKSKFIAQAEIASMAFAKELMDLPFSPNVLDVLLLYPHNKMMAEKVYEQITRCETYMR